MRAISFVVVVVVVVFSFTNHAGAISIIPYGTQFSFNLSFHEHYLAN